MTDELTAFLKAATSHYMQHGMKTESWMRVDEAVRVHNDLTASLRADRDRLREELAKQKARYCSICEFGHEGECREHR
jgi:hypothetical protein